MADLTSQIVMKADASGVEAGVGRAKRSLADLGAAGAASGKQVSDGLGRAGAGAKDAADKANRELSRLVGQIQRTSAAQEAGGRSTSEYFRVLARQRGVGTDALEPYLATLDAANAKQKIAAGSLDQVGMSAKAMSAALRGVPAQFTDIAVSIAGGQRPLTVLLQQGGQLKDMFGGIGPAAKALGGYVLGLINPFTIAAAAVTLLSSAFLAGSKEAEAYSKAIILTGNYVGQSVSSLTEMARAISRSAGGTQGLAADALTQVAGTGVVASQSLQMVASAAVEMERATGTAISKTVQQFIELADKPTKASEKLNETLHYLDLATYDHIRTLEEQGSKEEAAAVAQQAYARAVDDRTKQVRDSLGLLPRAWNAVGDAAKAAWDAMMNAGRPDTLSDQIQRAESALKGLKQAQANPGPYRGGATSSQIAQAQANVDFLKTARSAGEDQQADQADRARFQQEQIAARDRVEALKKSVRSEAAIRKEEIEQLQRDAAKLGLTKKEYDEAVAAINAKHKDPSTSSFDSHANALSKAMSDADLAALKATLEARNTIYRNADQVLQAQRAAGLVTDKQYYEQKRIDLELSEANQIRLLDAERTRLQQNTFVGKDAPIKEIENQKAIAEITAKIGQVKADTATKATILNIQEKASILGVKASLESARQSAEEYLQTLTLRGQREIAAVGQSDRERNFASGRQGIEDDINRRRRDLKNSRELLELQEKFSPQAKEIYDSKMATLDDLQAKALQRYKDTFAGISAAQADWSNGADRAFKNYADSARDVAKQTEDLFTRGFNNIEDALVEFTTTGKLNFKSLANSIIADFVRIQVRGALTGGSGGGLFGSLIGLFGGTAGKAAVASSMSGDSLDNLLKLTGNFSGRASGGPVSAGGAYIVGERGPEILRMGSQSGSITPNDKIGGGVQIVNNVAAGVSRNEMLQALNLSQKATEASILNTLRKQKVLA